jgi:hypothetical protein
VLGQSRHDPGAYNCDEQARAVTVLTAVHHDLGPRRPCFRFVTTAFEGTCSTHVESRKEVALFLPIDLLVDFDCRR